MRTIADISVDQILLFLMAFVRVASMIALFPIFGSRNAPLIAKVGLSLILAVILFPLLDTTVVTIPTGIFSFAVIAVKEILIGIVMGFAGSLIFAVLQFGGRIIDQQMAFAMAQIMDPVTDTQVTLIAQLNVMLFTIIFLLIGGHRMFISAMAYSFEIINVGSVNFASDQIAQHLLHMTSQIFVLGLKFAAPVMVTLLLTTTALGIVARTVPQMNIFIVGLPLKIGMGLLLIIVTLPTLVNLFEEMVFSIKKDIFILIKYMA